MQEAQSNHRDLASPKSPLPPSRQSLKAVRELVLPPDKMVRKKPTSLEPRKTMIQRLK